MKYLLRNRCAGCAYGKKSQDAHLGLGCLGKLKPRVDEFSSIAYNIVTQEGDEDDDDSDDLVKRKVVEAVREYFVPPPVVVPSDSPIQVKINYVWQEIKRLMEYKYFKSPTCGLTVDDITRLDLILSFGEAIDNVGLKDIRREDRAEIYEAIIEFIEK